MESAKTSMVDLWLACPCCHLAFSSGGEYENHFAKEHVGRKFKRAGRLKTHSTQLD